MHHKKHHSSNFEPKAHDPDRGPPMQEGAHHFDKGYHSDEETFQPASYPPGDDHYRGNDYFKMRNDVIKKDSKCLERNKFTKHA
jgi:hypothetical protein